MHRLLIRQLKKQNINLDNLDNKLVELFDEINKAYFQTDEDRYMLERSLELSSEELIEANSGLRAIFEALPDLFIRMDLTGKILEYKSGNENDLITTSISLIGKRIQDIPIPEASRKFNEALNLINETNNLISIEYAVGKNHQKAYYEARLKLFSDEQIIVLIRNITAQKQIEEALKNIALNVGNTKISGFFEDMVVYVSKMLNVKYAMIAGFNYQNKLIANMIALCDNDELIKNFDISLENSPCGDVIARGILIIKDDVVTKYPNAPVFTEMNIKSYIGISLKDSTGKLIGIMSILDIKPLEDAGFAESLMRIIGTRVSSELERKIYNEELIAAKEHAESSDKLKSEFLAQISHEIRTPVNTILNYVTLIKEELEGTANEDIARSIEVIKSGGKRLIRTIDLVLNMADIQTGAYNADRTEIYLKERILMPLIAEFSYSAQQRGLKLTVDNKNKNDIKLQLDKYTVTQIFANLIDNGIKYTKTGGVKIKILTPKQGQLCVRIIDSGIGMSQEFLPQLFQTFTQEDTGYTRKYEGNGLGMALVKKYCEINKIEISVESKKNYGTIFSLCFPLDNVS